MVGKGGVLTGYRGDPGRARLFGVDMESVCMLPSAGIWAGPYDMIGECIILTNYIRDYQSNVH